MNKEELTRLYNTLITIETKGTHTKTMADCLRYIESAIARDNRDESVSVSGETNGEK